MKILLVLLSLIGQFDGKLPDDLPKIRQALYPTKVFLYSASYTGPLYRKLTLIVPAVNRRVTIDDGKMVNFQLTPGQMRQYDLPSRVEVEGYSGEFYLEYELEFIAGKDHWRVFVGDGEVIRLLTKTKPSKTWLAVHCSKPVEMIPVQPDTLKDGMVCLPIQVPGNSFASARRYLEQGRKMEASDTGFRLEGNCDVSVCWIIAKNGLELGTGTIDTSGVSNGQEFKAAEVKVISRLSRDRPVLIRKIKVIPKPRAKSRGFFYVFGEIHR